MTHHLHILPFGQPAWERRGEIITGIIAARTGPPWDFRDILYLVPNERMVKTLRVLFLELLKKKTGASGCIPPHIAALNRFVISRAGGARIIKPLARKLLLEEICQGLAGKITGLDNEHLARSLSGPVSGALERAYLHNALDRLPTIKDKSTQLSALVEARKEYERRLNSLRLSDPAEYLSKWEPKAGDFPEFKTVILDGFYDALPHELRLMKALRADRDFYFILEAPGLSSELCGEGMPYAGTDKLIRELFPDIKEFDCPLAPSPKPLAPALLTPALDILSGALFLGRPLHALIKEARLLNEPRMTIISALTIEDEAAFIARTIKEGAINGKIDLDKTLVLSPEPEGYSHALKEIFTDYGIPYSFHETRPLLSFPVAQAFMDLLCIPAEDYPFRLMRRALLSPFILPPKENETGNALEFDGLAREKNLLGGRRLWEGLLRGEDMPFSAGLSRLLERLQPLEAKELHPAKWLGLAEDLLSKSEMERTASEIGDPETKAALDALKACLVELDEAVRGLTRKVTLARFIGMLKAALSEVRIGRKADSFSGVRVLNRLEVSSEAFDTVFIAGLSEGAFPAPPRRDLFDRELEGVGIPPSDKRTRDSRLFFRLLLGARDVYLSYPKEAGGRPASPSPWVMALKPFVIAGASSEPVDRPLINDYCRPSAPKEALGKEELLRALALNDCGADALKDALRLVPENVSFTETVCSSAPPDIPLPPPDKRRFYVTELEDYLKCGYRYYHRWVVRDLPPPEPEPDAAPDEAGRAVHKILAQFYSRRSEPVRPEEMDEAYREISRLADREFTKLPDTIANREAHRRFLEEFAPRALKADSELPLGTVISEVEKKIEAEIPVSGSETITLTGKIDRLEISKDGSYEIVDYKTGRYPGNGGPALKDNFQLPLYAYLLRKYLPERRPSAFVFYNLGRQGETRDVVCYDCSLHPGGAVTSKERKREDGGKMDEYIEGVAERAKEAARGIMSGSYPPARDKKECRNCEIADACPGADAGGPEDGGGGNDEG